MSAGHVHPLAVGIELGGAVYLPALVDRRAQQELPRPLLVWVGVDEVAEDGLALYAASRVQPSGTLRALPFIQSVPAALRQ